MIVVVAISDLQVDTDICQWFFTVALFTILVAIDPSIVTDRDRAHSTSIKVRIVQLVRIVCVTDSFCLIDIVSVREPRHQVSIAVFLFGVCSTSLVWVGKGIAFWQFKFHHVFASCNAFEVVVSFAVSNGFDDGIRVAEFLVAETSLALTSLADDDIGSFDLHVLDGDGLTIAVEGSLDICQWLFIWVLDTIAIFIEPSVVTEGDCHSLEVIDGKNRCFCFLETFLSISSIRIDRCLDRMPLVFTMLVWQGGLNL